MPADGAESTAAAHWAPVGRSVRGAPIEAVTIGRGPLRVLIVGGIHGNEPEAAAAIEPIRRRLLEDAGRATVRLIRDVNPDGTAAGTRGNARGVDLNRNWPTACFSPTRSHGEAAISEPETAVLLGEIESFRPDVIVVCHSIRSGPFVNFDGPAADLAARFARAAAAVDRRWHVRPSMGYPTPGSLGTWAGVERGVPILTVEFRRGDPAERVVAPLLEGLAAITQGHD